MIKEICKNKKAYHDYQIFETYEAGIILSGLEIKAIRAGKVNLTGSHARVFQTRNPKFQILNSKQITNHKSQINKPELFLLGANIAVKEGDPQRTRKLLLHRQEISKLIGKTQEKNLTLVPTKLYIKKGRAKIELGLGRGKKLHDKRETIKKRDQSREDRGKVR